MIQGRRNFLFTLIGALLAPKLPLPAFNTLGTVTGRAASGFHIQSTPNSSLCSGCGPIGCVGEVGPIGDPGEPSPPEYGFRSVEGPIGIEGHDGPIGPDGPIGSGGPPGYYYSDLDFNPCPECGAYPSIVD